MLTQEQLREPFECCFKAKDDWLIGLEVEKIGVNRKTGTTVPFKGKSSVENFLHAVGEQSDWKKEYEDKNLVKLLDGQRNITLEPGSQMELSGAPYPNLHDVYKGLQKHRQEIFSPSKDLDIAWLGIGLNPYTPIEQIPLIPKKRYEIMWQRMAKTGRMGRVMMKQSAAVQVNLDAYDEDDLFQKVTTAAKLSPLVVAMTANSPVCGGELTDYQSFRAHVWQNTDKHRCGLPEVLFDQHFSIKNYIEYALDVPMYFIQRDNQLAPLQKYSFRRFMQQGYQNKPASMDDWKLHLNTIFTEVRLNCTMELRSADNLPFHFVMGIPAFWKGIMYHNDALQAVRDILKDWKYQEVNQLWIDVSKQALQAQMGRHNAIDLIKELLNIANDSLKQQAKKNEHNQDESVFLNTLEQIILHEKATLADKMRKKWQESWKENPSELIEFYAY